MMTRVWFGKENMIIWVYDRKGIKEKDSNTKLAMHVFKIIFRTPTTISHPFRFRLQWGKVRFVCQLLGWTMALRVGKWPSSLRGWPSVLGTMGTVLGKFCLAVLGRLQQIPIRLQVRVRMIGESARVVARKWKGHGSAPLLLVCVSFLHPHLFGL